MSIIRAVISFWMAAVVGRPLMRDWDLPPRAISRLRIRSPSSGSKPYSAAICGGGLVVGNIEDSLYDGLFGSGADHLAAGPLAQRHAHGIHNDRLARAGLTREHVEPRPDLEPQVIDKAKFCIWSSVSIAFSSQPTAFRLSNRENQKGRKREKVLGLVLGLRS